MKEKISIHWFRKDLRLKDNPSLNYLIEKGYPIIFIYIHDEINADRPLGSASKVWLYHSLDFLNKHLNGKLIFFKGQSLKIFHNLDKMFDIQTISWNRCYEPWMIRRDKKIKESLKDKVEDIRSFNGSLLSEPWEILKDDGTPYRVFTPYYKKVCLKQKNIRKPKTKKVKFFDHSYDCDSLETLELMPKKKWASSLISSWKIGEYFANQKMVSFFKNGMNNYKEGRDFPSRNNVSRLSPYIHWGQISTNTLWHNIDKFRNYIPKGDIEKFKSQLGWREFSYYLLYHFPYMNEENFQKKFDKFIWKSDDNYISKWTKGRTGFPIVDAGMRELWNTGFMHNRVRMIVGSFFSKNLLHHWKNGEEWFWDCLFDADLANNSVSWQWIAGTGVDAAPFFRIFNPVIQGQKFDPNGEYIKKYVPELKKLPLKYLFRPWDCPSDICQKIDFKKGFDYPNPIVDLKRSREKALSLFLSLKK
jgi:deoxyribodipyrimidine photo-lyase